MEGFVALKESVLELQRRKAAASLNGKTYSDKKDVRDPWVYYDTYTLDASAAPTVLFNNGSSAKARSLTNYPFQTLPTGQSFDIQGLRVSYSAHALMADATHQLLLTFLAKTVIQVQIVNKQPSYERTLAGLIGGQMQIATAPAVTVNSQNLSKWTADTVVHFKKKIYLDQTVQCNVNILKDVAPDAALTGDFLRFEWLGRFTSLL
jgi:hypothetical protein